MLAHLRRAARCGDRVRAGATVAITTIEYEPGAVADLAEVLERLIPRAPGGYEHNRLNGDTNAHAHLRAALIGPSESIPVIGGELALGTWQQIVLLDFDDRPRERTSASRSRPDAGGAVPTSVGRVPYTARCATRSG